MQINNISSEKFNGLKITKPVKKIITNFYLNELDQANSIYQKKLANKQLHNEKLFQKIFNPTWDKLDAYDNVIMKYSLDNANDLSLRKKGKVIIANTFQNSLSGKIKINSQTIKNKEEFFDFINNQFQKIFKRKK